MEVAIGDLIATLLEAVWGDNMTLEHAFQYLPLHPGCDTKEWYPVFTTALIQQGDMMGQQRWPWRLGGAYPQHQHTRSARREPLPI